MPPGTPPSPDFAVPADVVRQLLTEQHPDLAHLPLELAATGWDNVTYRLGDDLAVRLPHRAVAAPLISTEQTWLPHIQRFVDVAIPAPIRVGIPGSTYQWHWSVVPWITGTTALESKLNASAPTALGTALSQLHRAPLPDDAPINPFRGGPLDERLQDVAERLRRAPSVDAVAALRTFQKAVAAPRAELPTWIHGDLHSKNVITRHGDIVGIIDWGDMCAGDPATDLAAMWMVLDSAGEAPFRAAYGPVSTPLHIRAAGWAISYGLMLWETHYESEPSFAARAIDAVDRASVV